MSVETFPTKPGDWVAAIGNHSRLGIVKAVYEGEPGEVLMDLRLVNHKTGDIIGRESPAMGGPRSFEPACSFEGWERIDPPSFPLPLSSIPTSSGGFYLDYYAGPALPHLSWKPRARRGTGKLFMALENTTLRKALEAIADGANDARDVAAKALGRKP